MSSEEGSKSTLDIECKISRGTQFEAFKELNELRKTNTLCDVNIVIQETVFPCHRNVLTAASDYFRAMFTDNFEEQKKEDVKLNDIEADIFEQILNFMYLGEIRINTKNVTSLLVTCDYLGLQYIEDLCITYIKNNIPLNNIAELFSFASTTKKVDLIHTLCEFIKMNFIDLSRSNELIKLPVSDLGKIFKYMDSELNTDAAVVLLSKWMEVHQDKTALKKLLQRVNISDISVSCLAEVIVNGAIEISEVNTYQLDEDDDIEPRKSLYSISLCKDAVNEKYEWVLHPIRPANLKRRQVLMERNSSYATRSFDELKAIALNEEIIYAFYQHIGSYCTYTIQPFAWNNEFSSIRKSSPNMSLFKFSNSNLISSHLNMAAVRHRIYFYQVHKGQQLEVLYALTSYNCERNEWIAHTDSIQNLVPVQAPSMVSLNHNLYVIGGFIASDEVNIRGRDGGVAQFIDLRSNKWHRLPNSLFEHTNGAACVHDDKIYVTGGDHLSYFNRVAEVFDPVASKWRALSPMPRYRTKHTLVSLENRLYAFNGLKSRNVEPDFKPCVYNIKDDKWNNAFTVNATTREANDPDEIIKIYDVIVM